MESFKVKCDSCNAVVIQNIPCHETGCPKSTWKWVKSDDNYLVPTRPIPKTFDPYDEWEKNYNYNELD